MGTERLVDHFVGFSDDSPIWIYQADRMLSDFEANEIGVEIEKFANQWVTHGTKLKAKAVVVDQLFLIFMVDSALQPSGCSKDSKVHLIKELEQSYSVNFMNRMRFAYLDSANQIKLADVGDLSTLVSSNEFTPDTLVFNNLVATKKDLENNWKIPAKSSWHNNFM